MCSTRVDFESPHSCGHFDTKIKVATMKNIRARVFSNVVNPKCAPDGGQPLKGLNHVTTL